MEALFAQLLPRAGVGGRWTSGSNIGVRLLKSCVGSALVKRYRAASAPSTCAVTVPYQRSPMKKTKVAVRERVTDPITRPPLAYRSVRLSPVPVLPPTTIAVPSAARKLWLARRAVPLRSEEHTSELQSLLRISYAVFCLKKKK